MLLFGLRQLELMLWLNLRWLQLFLYFFTYIGASTEEEE